MTRFASMLSSSDPPFTPRRIGPLEAFDVSQLREKLSKRFNHQHGVCGTRCFRIGCVLAPDALFYGESFPVVTLPPRSASLSGAEAGKEHQSNRGLGLEPKASFYVLRSLEHVQDCDQLVGRAGVSLRRPGCLPRNDRPLDGVNSVDDSDIFGEGENTAQEGLRVLQ
jgi:hypothetical protein